MNESAAASLAEGLEETLMLHRLNVAAELGVSFKTTNLIERMMARVEARTRRVKNHRHLPLLKQALQNKLSLEKSTAA